MPPQIFEGIVFQSSILLFLQEPQPVTRQGSLTEQSPPHAWNDSNFPQVPFTTSLGSSPPPPNCKPKVTQLASGGNKIGIHLMPGIRLLHPLHPVPHHGFRGHGLSQSPLHGGWGPGWRRTPRVPPEPTNLWPQLLLTVSRLLEVDVGITQGAAGDHIAADPDGQHRPRRTELFVQHGLGDVRVQVTHVQGGHGVAAGRSVHLPAPHPPEPRQEDFLSGPPQDKGALLRAVARAAAHRWQ